MGNNIIILQILVVFACVIGVIVYRVTLSVDYCPGKSAVECLLLTTVLSSVLNGVSILILGKVRGRHSREHIVNGFTTTCVISAYPVHGEVYLIQHNVIKFVSDLWKVGVFHGVLRFPHPIKLTVSI